MMRKKRKLRAAIPHPSRTTGWPLVPLFAALFLSGCGKAPPPVPAADTNLTQFADLFTPPGSRIPIPRDPDAVIATINGEPLRQKDLLAEMTLIRARLRQRLPPERIRQMNNRIIEAAMDSVVTKSVLRHAIESEDVQVDTGEVARVMARIKAALPDETTLDNFLTRNRMTEQMFRDKVALELRFRKLLDRKAGTPPTPTDEEIDAYYAAHTNQLAGATLAEARPRIIAALQAAARQRAIADYVLELKRAAKVVIPEPAATPPTEGSETSPSPPTP